MKNQSFLILLLAASALLAVGCNKLGKSKSVASDGQLHGVAPTAKSGMARPFGMVFVPPGTFHMGPSDEDVNYNFSSRNKAVSISGFWMDKTEVTNDEYYEFMKETGYKPASATKFLSHWNNDRPVVGEESMPVRYVNLEDVNAFAEWRSKRDGVDYRLPTEQEWEFAARNGPRGNLFPWGNQFDPNCAFIDQEKGTPVSVRTRSCPDEWGVVDLVGNVAEWTSSTAWLYPESEGSVQIPMKEPQYMVRGGGARNSSSGERPVTSTWRVDVPALTRHASLGFRLVTSQ